MNQRNKRKQEAVMSQMKEVKIFKEAMSCQLWQIGCVLLVRLSSVSHS